MFEKNLECIVVGKDPAEDKRYVVLSIFTNDRCSYSHTTANPENRDFLLGYLVGVLYGSVDEVRDTNMIYNGIPTDVRERFESLEAMKLSKLNEKEFKRIIKDSNKAIVSLGGQSFSDDRIEECWLCKGRGYNVL